MSKSLAYPVLVGFLWALSLAAQATADDLVDKVNAPYEGLPDDERSDLIILRSLVDMQEPPAAFTSAQDAALLPPEGANWEAARAWAESESQKPPIEALATITEENIRRKARRFAQPYGIEGVAGEIELINAGLYTELGDPPILARADIRYMDKFRSLEILVHVNTTRLLNEGEAGQALTGLVDWALFCRQIADRQFIEELRWSMEAIGLALARMRDVAYVDAMSDTPSLTTKDIKDTIARMSSKAIESDQISLGQGDFMAAEQLLRAVIDEGGDADPDRFGATMARIGAQDRPLRLFSEAAYWDRVRESHAGWWEAKTMADNVRRDYGKRWGLQPFDPILKNPSDYKRNVVGNDQFAVIAFVVKGYDDLFDLRRRLRTEYAGTTDSLGVRAYMIEFNAPPTKLSTIRPRYVRVLAHDPFSRDPKATLKYFIPVKDTPRGPRGQARPWVIEIFPHGDYEPFEVPFVEPDMGIVYSIGVDEKADKAKRSVQDRAGAIEGDYLIWPPVLSLLRKNLIDNGQLP